MPVSSAGRYLSPPTRAAAASPAGRRRCTPTVTASVLTRPRSAVAPPSWGWGVLVGKANVARAAHGPPGREGAVVGHARGHGGGRAERGAVEGGAAGGGVRGAGGRW